MNQEQIQLWNDAVDACCKAVMDQVLKLEVESSMLGAPHEARSVVRVIKSQYLADDDRQKINLPNGFTIDDFPKVDE